MEFALLSKNHNGSWNRYIFKNGDRITTSMRGSTHVISSYGHTLSIYSNGEFTWYCGQKWRSVSIYGKKEVRR